MKVTNSQRLPHVSFSSVAAAIDSPDVTLKITWKVIGLGNMSGRDQRYDVNSDGPQHLKFVGRQLVHKLGALYRIGIKRSK